MTMAINLTVLDKNFCYCNNCIKNNTITKLNANKTKEVYVSPCEHKGRYFSYLKWCDKCGNFTYHRGNNIKAECYSCVMSKNSLKAIEKGLHSCQNPETSLANKKLHQKTIESQIKNGTFNMMQPEIHAKATKNKMKNYASGKCKCKICGKEDILNCYGVCGECQSKYALENVKDKFCEKCNRITRHNGNICCICHPKSDVLNRSSFITKNNVRYYKGIEVETFSKKILSGELDINNYPGINIRFNRVCYGTEDIITSQKILKVSKFETKDNILYFYDRSINDYIPWENYKKKFIIQSNKLTYKNNIIPGFKLYSTFRAQDSEDWSGGIKQAFEQSLIDDSISWFIYIKFYLDMQNNSKPLVCGKSGSLLVNSNGSDLSFSTDINDGPARRFLAENSGKYLWDKTKIAILPCNSEKEAYELERKYTNLLNLFGS